MLLRLAFVLACLGPLSVDGTAQAFSIEVSEILMASPDPGEPDPDSVGTYLLEVNSAGLAVGGHDNGGLDPYIFDPLTGEGRILRTTGSEQYAINNAGESSGNIGDLLDELGNPILTFPVPAGALRATVHRLTETGYAMGFSREVGSNETNRAARWEIQGTSATRIDLDTRVDDSQSRAWGGSESGMVAGYYDGLENGTAQEAVVWLINGTIVDTVFLDQAPGHLASLAHNVNDAGQAVGFTDVGEGRQATLWNVSGGVTLLPLLPGTETSFARAISESGIIAGESWTPGGLIATLWINQGLGYSPVALEGLLETSDAAPWILRAAHFVRDGGYIVGYGDYEVSPGNWVERGFLVDFNEVPGPCDDGVDNDGDGQTDFPTDPGCRDRASQTEAPACDDENDNDGDGGIDWDGGAGGGAPDPQCSQGWRNNERQSCGVGPGLALVLPLLLMLRAGSTRRRSRDAVRRP